MCVCVFMFRTAENYILGFYLRWIFNLLLTTFWGTFRINS